MNDKEQIEEMAKIISDAFMEDYNIGCDPCTETVARALYNAGYRKQEWISVQERLPKECTHIIVCDEDGAVGEALCYKEGRFEWIDSEEIAFVTHWMPLPEPPKGGAE